MASLRDEITQGEFQPKEQPNVDQLFQPRGGGAERPSSLREQIQGGQFGPQIISEGPEALGEPGLDDATTRFKMGQGGNFEEKVQAFKQQFPEGDLVVRQMDGEPTLLFRKDNDSPFAKVDAGLTERFEPVGDLMDFLGEDGGAILGEIAATASTRGLSLIGLATRLFAGGTVGDLGQEAIQTLRGEQRESFEEVVTSAAGKGAFGAATGTGSEILMRNAINLFRGAGLTGTQEGTRRVFRSADRLGVDRPPLDLVADSPVVKGLGTLSRASAPTLPRYVANIRQSTRRVAQELRNVGDKARAAGNIESVVNTARERFLREASFKVSTRKQTVDFAKAVDTYDTAAQARINSLYQRARAIEEPQFDISAVKTDAARVLRGARAQNVELGNDLQRVLKDIMKFRGKPRAIKLPDGTMETVPVIDQLNGFREALFNIQHNPPQGIDRRVQKMAKRIRGQIGDAIDNVEGADPKFNELWREASSAARERFETLEKGIVVRARQTETPEGFARRLIDNQELQDVEFLERAGVDLNDLRGVFVDRGLNRPRQTIEQLDQMRPELRRKFITRADEQVIRNYADQVERLDALGIDRIRAKQSEISGFIGEVLNQGTRQLDTLRQLVDDAGGLESEVGRSVRAAIVDRVIKNSTVTGGGRARIDASALRSEIDRLREVGGFKLLTKSDGKTLLSIKDIEDVVASGEDFGASLARQEMLSGLRGGATGNLGAARRAAVTLAEQLSMGRLLTSEGGRRLLVGSGKRKIPRSGAMAVAAATAAEAFKSESVEETERKLDNIMGAL